GMGRVGAGRTGSEAEDTPSRSSSRLSAMTHREPARRSAPRIPPLGDDEADEQAKALLEEVRLPNAEAVNIFATLVRNPGLYRRWIPFAGKQLPGTLTAPD